MKDAYHDYKIYKLGDRQCVAHSIKYSVFCAWLIFDKRKKRKKMKRDSIKL